MSQFTVDPVVGLQNTSYKPRSSANNDLGSVDFMTLIITQMRNQNPLDPQSDSDFMAQMAQFEALNQMKLVAQGIQVIQGLNELTGATGFIGKEVTGQQVDAINITRDQVGREVFSAPFSQLTSAQKALVNRDDRVVAAAADLVNAGREVTGTVDKVVVGPDGVPMLFVAGKVVDPFTVSQVQ
jgi:flagellar hook assembly protein FlgD